MSTLQRSNNFERSKRPWKIKKKGQQYGQDQQKQENFILAIRENIAIPHELNQKKKNYDKNQNYLNKIYMILVRSSTIIIKKCDIIQKSVLS